MPIDEPEIKQRKEAGGDSSAATDPTNDAAMRRISGRQAVRDLRLAPEEEFSEPVALSSTLQTDFWSKPTTRPENFNLLALRARCKGKYRERVSALQG